MLRSRATRVSLGVLGALAFSCSLALPATADIQAQSTDVVGVGSDTLQYLMDFGLEGDPSGDAGYNSGNTNRVFNFDATADANARNAYQNLPQVAGNAPFLRPTVVMRQGAFPVQRVNGSGDGLAAFLLDTNTPRTFDYGRTSRPPKASEQATASNSAHNWGGLHTIQLGTDPLVAATFATATGVSDTYLPHNISVAELKNIFNCTHTTIGQIPGQAANAHASQTIFAIAPQLGSGTSNSFLTDLGIASYGSCVIFSEENDPLALGAVAVPQAAIAPISGARVSLYSGTAGTGGPGYFKDPTKKFGTAQATLTPNVLLAQATPGVVTAASGATTVTVTKRLSGTDPSSLVGGTMTEGANTYAITAASGTGTTFSLTLGSGIVGTYTAKPVQLNLAPATDGLSGGTTYEDDRGMYVYFRQSDLLAVGATNSTNPGAFQPGGTQNFVQSLLFNPCVGSGCSGFGPGGAPFFASSGGQALIAAAGFVPNYVDKGATFSVG